MKSMIPASPLGLTAVTTTVATVVVTALLAGCPATGGTPMGARNPTNTQSPEESATDLAKDPASRSDQLLAQWHRDNAPGLAVIVTRHGEIIYQRVFGAAQLEHHVAITEDTVFQAASVAKQFTAFAILTLAQQGALSLDDDVRKHLPEIPDFGHTITLRHLLHHQSGLRDQWALMEMSGGRWEDRQTNADLMNQLRDQRELDFVPGTQFSYSNTGYTVLTEVVARVTGVRFSEWTKEHVFVPLAMEHSQFIDDTTTVVEHLAASYSPSGDGFEGDALNQASPGPSSLYTTITDLAKWTNNLDTAAVGGRAVIDAMHERSVLSGVPMDYAGGLYHGSHHGLRFVGHGGSHAGYRAAALRYPDHGLAVLVLANDSSVNATRMATQVAEFHLLDGAGQDANDADAANDAGDAGDAGQDAGQAFDAQVLDTYIGKFKLPGDMIVEFERDGATLFILFQGARIPLVRESDNTFALPAFSARITFERDQAGTAVTPVTHVTIDRGGQLMPGDRIPFDPPSADELGDYTGHYLSPELQTFYTVELADGQLLARTRRKADIVLTPAERDGFTSDTWYFGRVVFKRDPSGAVIEMRVSGTRARNVLFVRQPVNPTTR